MMHRTNNTRATLTRSIVARFATCTAVAVTANALQQCTDPEASGPPILHVGEDVCADCGMSIVESKYAAAVLYEYEGVREHAVFDDVGCMKLWERDLEETRIIDRWSGTTDRDQWIDVREGFFVVGSSVRTPMDFHILCCSTREAAEQIIATSGGAVTPFDSVEPVLPTTLGR